MKYCSHCGAQINATDRFCLNCGTPTETPAPVSTPQVSSAPDPVYNIENAVAAYYNSTYLSPNQPGKYIVSHCDTTVVGNTCHLLVRYQNHAECMPVPVANITADLYTGRWYISKEPTPESQPATKMNISIVCLLLLIGCVLIWAMAPFVAVNLLTMNNQPSALQLVMKDVLILGDLTQTPAYLAALLSILGIVVCLITTCVAANKVTLGFALATELPLGWVLLEYADYLEYADEWFGIGFWGIIVIMLVVAIVSGLTPSRKPC